MSRGDVARRPPPTNASGLSGRYRRHRRTSHDEQPTVDDLGRPAQRGGDELRATGTTRRTARARAAAAWLDERTGLAAPRPDDPAQGVPRPLVVPAGRDRAVLLRDPRSRPAPFLTFFFVPVAGSRSPTRARTRPSQGAAVSAGLRLRAAALVRGPGGAADAPGPPLDRGRVRRRHRRPPRAGLLHRRVPPAARAQLAARVRAAPVRHRGGLHRLLAARRPAVGDRRPDRLLGGALDPVRRAVPRVARVRRRVPDRRRSSARLLRAPRDAAAGACSSATIAAHVGLVFLQKHTQFRGRLPARGQRRRPPLLARPGVPLGRAVLPHRGGAWRSWAASCRSTRSGPTGRSSRRSCRRPRSPTGTWAGSTGRSGSGHRSSRRSWASRSRRSFLPGIVLPGVLFTIVALWPFDRARGDRRPAASTTCSTGRGRRRSGRRPARRSSRSSPSSRWPAATTSSRCSSTCPSRPSPGSSGSWSSSCPSSSRSITYALCRAGCAGPRPTSWRRTMRPPAIPRAVGGATRRARRRRAAPVGDGGFEEVEA